MRVRDLHGYPADRRVDQDEAALEVYQAARQRADVVGEVRCRDKMEGLHPAGVHEDRVVIDDTHADRSEDQRCRRVCVLARKLVVQSAGRERSFQDREERLINHRKAKGAEVEVELGAFLESDELWPRRSKRRRKREIATAGRGSSWRSPVAAALNIALGLRSP